MNDNLEPTLIKYFRALSMMALLFACVALTPAIAQQPASPQLKVLIVVDMEGIAGVVTSDQLGPAGFEYERFRHFMTDEALAAVRGAKAAGATEIVVGDSHGNGESLLIEEFPRDVRIARSWPRHNGMMGTIDSSFAAVVFVGYHASASSPGGVRAHTFSSATFTRVAINGRAVGEGEFGAALAGEQGVPVVFISGDDVATAELRGRIANIVTVETKQALGFHSALTLTPAEATARIEAGVQKAVGSLRDIKPYAIKAPITLELDYKNYAAAETMGYLRSVQRVGSRTIRFVGKDMGEVGGLHRVCRQLPARPRALSNGSGCGQQLTEGDVTALFGVVAASRTPGGVRVLASALGRRKAQRCVRRRRRGGRRPRPRHGLPSRARSRHQAHCGAREAARGLRQCRAQHDRRALELPAAREPLLLRGFAASLGDAFPRYQLQRHVQRAWRLRSRSIPTMRWLAARKAW